MIENGNFHFHLAMKILSNLNWLNPDSLEAVNDRCIINVAVGAWYPRGQSRLLESLLNQKFQGDFISWTDRYPPGSPSHEDLPYGFKSYAFQHAVKAGYRTILWLDCSCWAVRPLEPLFDEIESSGHLLSYEGWVAGEWLNDKALANLGVTRDEAMAFPLVGGMMMGVDLSVVRSQRWLELFTTYCQDGTTLPGTSHTNLNGAVSADPRCRGHVADQAVASIIAAKLGMQITHPPKWRDWAQSTRQTSETIILARGL